MIDINNENNTELPLSHYGIYFSYLSTLCDKLICLYTGPGLFCLNEENKYIQNKIFFIDSNDPINFPAPKCIKNGEELICTYKYNLFIKHYIYLNDEDLILDLENFINII